jgi:hypothetical protein
MKWLGLLSFGALLAIIGFILFPGNATLVACVVGICVFMVFIKMVHSESAKRAKIQKARQHFKNKRIPSPRKDAQKGVLVFSKKDAAENTETTNDVKDDIITITEKDFIEEKDAILLPEAETKNDTVTNEDSEILTLTEKDIIFEESDKDQDAVFLEDAIEIEFMLDEDEKEKEKTPIENEINKKLDELFNN